jgi:hypothetical protein
VIGVIPGCLFHCQSLYTGCSCLSRTRTSQTSQKILYWTLCSLFQFKILCGWKMKFLEDGTQQGKLFLSTLKRGRWAQNGAIFQNLDYHGSRTLSWPVKLRCLNPWDRSPRHFYLPVPFLITGAFLVSNFWGSKLYFSLKLWSINPYRMSNARFRKTDEERQSLAQSLRHPSPINSLISHDTSSSPLGCDWDTAN